MTRYRVVFDSLYSTSFVICLGLAFKCETTKRFLNEKLVRVGVIYDFLHDCMVVPIDVYRANRIECVRASDRTRASSDDLRVTCSIVRASSICLMANCGLC